MKSQVSLFRHLLKDVGDSCGISTSQDESTILRRVAEEGFSFLAITLPNYEKALLSSLELGHIDDAAFSGFGKVRGLPKLFSGFLRHIFSDDGLLLEHPSTQHLFAVRQLCCFYGKLDVECTEDRVLSAIRQYEVTDSSIKDVLDIPFYKLDYLRRLLGDLFHKEFQALDEDIYHRPGSLPYQHGPGVTAEKLGNNQRWSIPTWTERLEQVLPYGEAVAHSWRDFLSNSPQWLEAEQEPPVRVVTVPKTLKAPRVIAVEPVHNQYVQQGIYRALTGALESNAMWPSFGWDTQVTNQELARLGSIGGFATIDLSEASDRVSFGLVQHLFRDFPNLLEGIVASRSERAQLPDGRIIDLRKFASMGSALCFPIETLVFFGIAAMSFEEVHGRYPEPSHSTPAGLLPEVRVFGDDIIVPEDVVPALIRNLEDFGLKVNHGKSFFRSSFRESCGADYYEGVWVTPIRARSVLPDGRRNADTLLSTIALHNHLYEYGYERTTQYLRRILRSNGVTWTVPVRSIPNAPWSDRPSRNSMRWSSTLHRIEFRGIFDKSKIPLDPINDHVAFRKVFRVKDTLLLAKDHLLRYGRPRSAATRIGWQAPEESGVYGVVTPRD